MRVALAAVALYACSIPDKHPGTVSDGPVTSDAASGHDGAGPPVDGAGSGPFACFGQPLPTTAPPTITVSGTVTEITAVASEPLSGAMLEVHPVPSGNAVANGFSDASGSYSMSVQTGGKPFNGFVVANGSGDLPVSVFPSRPFDSNTELAVTMITQQTLMLAGETVGISIVSTDTQFAIVIVDCDGTPLAGATLTSASGTVRYGSGGLPSQSALSTDTTGEVFVFNVVPGDFTVSGLAANGDPLRSHTVVGDGGGFTIALLQP